MAQTLLKGDGLPRSLFRAQEVRELDARAIADGSLTGYALMQRAGKSVFRQAAKRWPGAQNWLVLCGGGKNGGDGYIIAGLAALRGKSVRCLALSDPQNLKSEARQAYESALVNGVTVERFEPEAGCTALAETDVVIDAMLGTGLKDNVRAPYDEAIARVNGAAKPVVAVDIASGLSSDTGQVLGSAITAELTVTFIGMKLGLLTGHGPDVTGEIVFDALDVDPGIYHEVPAAATRLDWNTARAGWPERRPSAHKGDFGRVLIVGGDLGMGGAAVLAAEAAARAGAGMVFVATQPDNVPAFLARRPELIVRGVAHRNDLVSMLERMDAVIVGPGLGKGAWGRQLFHAVRSLYRGPVLADADALSLLAESCSPVAANWVLTPHPGEAARLLGKSIGEISEDRIKAVGSIAQRYQCTVLLKGAGTLIQGARPSDNVAEIQPEVLPTLIHGGNAGMATGGTGDVLSGFVGALLGAGLPGIDAATLGASLHGAAGDLLGAELSMAGLLAGDLPLAAARVLATTESRGLQMERAGHV